MIGWLEIGSCVDFQPESRRRDHAELENYGRQHRIFADNFSRMIQEYQLLVASARRSSDRTSLTSEALKKYAQ